jgi:hypothetical protein
MGEEIKQLISSPFFVFGEKGDKMKKAVSFNKEGILFADIFVNNKDLFVEMFAEYYRENY